jgi:hypothetical protein
MNVALGALLLSLGAFAPIDPGELEENGIRSEVTADEASAVAKAFCSALQARDLERIPTVLADGFKASGLDGVPEADTAAFVRSLSQHFGKAALLRRCSFKPFTFNTDKKHARALARMNLMVAGIDKNGSRFCERGEVKAEWVRVDKRFRFSALDFAPRTWTDGNAPEFEDVTSAAGLDPSFSEAPINIQGIYESGGIAVADYDDDGDLDIYVSRNGPNLLYRNDGNGRFTEVAAKAGVADPGDSRGVLFVDLDNDGKLDLFVANRLGKGNRLYHNDGNGHFTDVTARAGVGQRGYFTSVVAADVDGDGLLDLFVGQYNDSSVPHSPFDAHNGHPSLLLHNLGNMRFEEIGKKVGVAGREWTLAAAFGDLDGDHKPELLVVNDFGTPRLWHNLSKGPGDVHFEDITDASGLRDPGNGMGVDFGDYDNDGKLDIYISKMFSNAGNRLLSLNPSTDPEAMKTALMGARGNSLFHNDGNLHFSEVGEQAGVRRAGWAWGSEFSDVDNDGDLDIHVTNGYITGQVEDEL